MGKENKEVFLKVKRSEIFKHYKAVIKLKVNVESKLITMLKLPESKRPVLRIVDLEYIIHELQYLESHIRTFWEWSEKELKKLHEEERKFNEKLKQDRALDNI